MWLAADYDSRLIMAWFAEREWPKVNKTTLAYYRKRFAEDLERLRAERRNSALSTGLAVKEERVQRLKEHADELERIKWLPDEKGRLWNEKAWRETLDDIAKEVGGRIAKHEHTGADGAPLFTEIVVNIHKDEPVAD
jgi:predicted nuclease with TOPRIM domain